MDVDRLLEREEQLARLDERVESLRATRAGHIELIAGEAGIGKTSLVRAFREAHEGGIRFLWGACDPLFTPRPLGPIVDVAEETGGELAELAVAAAPPFDVAAALLRTAAAEPTVVVLEDLHWADEATLDVVRLVAGRVETVPTLIVATYRDDETDVSLPFRVVLGELVRHPSVSRIGLEPLSAAALEAVAQPHDLDPRELMRVTGGNPFFVTEVVAAGEERIPDTVRDAVLARVARLPGEAHPLLDAVAISPRGSEVWLLETLAPEALPMLDQCIASGMLTVSGETIAFRHELARLAVEGAVAEPRRRDLNSRALEALADRSVDQARLAHHAEAAGDADAVLEFAPAAGEQAAALGAHREAARYYSLALRHADRLAPMEAARLLERSAEEHVLVGEMTEAVRLGRRAAEAYRAEGALVRTAAVLRALLFPLWVLGRTEEAEPAGREAIAILEESGAGVELAKAYAALSFIAFWGGDVPKTAEWCERAVTLGHEADDWGSVARGLIYAGGDDVRHGVSGGQEKLQRGLALARREGLPTEVGTGLSVIANVAIAVREYETGSRYVAEAIEHCERYDLELWRPYVLAKRGELELERGEWDDARHTAATVVRLAGVGPATVIALCTLGRIRGRCADPDPWEPLDRARDLAVTARDIRRVLPAAAARAELAWLEGRDADAIAETEAAWELALTNGEPWLCGELAQWRRRMGAQDDVPPVAAPYGLALDGDWRGAYELWTQIGCPYEAALAAVDGDDEHRRRGLEILHELGAQKTAAVVARRLRAEGARGLPRGPRPQTASNPAQLSAREIDVLELLAEGLRNADIADRLVISPRTVDHHVSAILRKLDIGSRGEAAAAAVRLGLVAR